jgi:hypothetical protein
VVVVLVGNRGAGGGQLGNWPSVGPRKNVEEHNARARSVCLAFGPRINKEVAAGDGWIDGRVRATTKIMPVLPDLNLLVVTARAAWFNFRGWKKRP